MIPCRALKKAELQLSSLREQKEKVVHKQTAVQSKADDQRANGEALREAREEVAKETEQLRHYLALAVSKHVRTAESEMFTTRPSQVGLSDEHTAFMNKLQQTEQRLKEEVKRQTSIIRDLSKGTVAAVRELGYL